MWHECIGNRGGNEIASCLYEHIKAHQLSTSVDVNHLIFYSESCELNNNSTVASMFSMFIAAASDTIEVIDHKSLAPGHVAQMECDVDHTVIERKRAKSLVQIHHPRDWYQFVRGARSKNPFVVHEMSQENFRNFRTMAKTKFTFRKVNEERESVCWHAVRWLRYTREVGKIFYKYTLDDDEPFKVVNIRRRGVLNLCPAETPKCYVEPIKISTAKKQDLIAVLPLIDGIYHEFYMNLPAEQMLDYHLDLTEKDQQPDEF